ncbi:hypothetical protein MTO96_014417 [Rhipicephalus appendiculatus]
MSQSTTSGAVQEPVVTSSTEVKHVPSPLTFQAVYDSARAIEFLGAMVHALMYVLQVESVYNVLLAVIDRDHLATEERASIALLFERLRSEASRTVASSSILHGTLQDTFTEVVQRAQTAFWPKDIGHGRRMSKAWTAGGSSRPSEDSSSSAPAGDECVEEGIFPDVPALKTTYEAYILRRRDEHDVPLSDLDNYPTEQVFFMTACHTHCHLVSDGSYASHRCTVAMRNFRHFAAAFHCAYGSPMHPFKHCDF